jgi:hypothetical protein
MARRSRSLLGSLATGDGRDGARVNAMLVFYPGGVRQIGKNYPGISEASPGAT